MRTYPANRWVSGTYKRECAVCGWDYLRSEMVMNRDGFVVCQKCHYPDTSYEETTHPVITERPLIKD